MAPLQLEVQVTIRSESLVVHRLRIPILEVVCGTPHGMLPIGRSDILRCMKSQVVTAGLLTST